VQEDIQDFMAIRQQQQKDKLKEAGGSQSSSVQKPVPPAGRKTLRSGLSVEQRLTGSK